MNRHSVNLFNIINYSVFIVIAVIMLYPFWYTLVGSFVPFSQYAQDPILLYPKSISLKAYEKVLSNSLIASSYTITLFSTTVGTALSMLMTVLGAYVFSRKFFPGKNIMFYLIIFSMLFSGGTIPLFITLNKFRLVNNIWVYVFNPMLLNTFYLLIMRTSFQSLPAELEDSGRIDGCQDFGILFRIIIPTSKAILATIMLFYAVDKWNDLSTGLFFISDSKKMSLQVILYNILTSVESSQGNVGDSANAMISEQVKLASIVITTLPILLFYPYLQKYFIKGVMIGAIKG